MSIVDMDLAGYEIPYRIVMFHRALVTEKLAIKRLFVLIY